MAQQSNDEELVQRIKQGDAQALDALVNSYLSKTYNRVRCLVPEADAEDVTQEIFLALVRSIDNFNGKSAFSTWLYRIMMNKVADYHRTATRREKSEQIAAERDIFADSWSQEDAEITIKKILRNIPESEREIILMRLSDNLSFHEISTRLGLTYEATRSRYRRAIELVRAKVRLR